MKTYINRFAFIYILISILLLLVSCELDDTVSNTIANKSPTYAPTPSNTIKSPEPTIDTTPIITPTVQKKNSLIISEIVSSNSLYPIDGQQCDWFEIKNISSETINLKNYYASNKPGISSRYQLPDIQLDSNEYYVVCCGVDVLFNLSKDGEKLYLTNHNGNIIDFVDFPKLDKNTSWTYDKGIVSYPSPYYENTPKGNTQSITSRVGIVISEVVASNTKFSPYKRKYYDIIELYNNSDESIDLSEYFISDKNSDLKKYKLPQKILKPSEYYIVYCDNEATGLAPFGISSSGDNLFISDSNGYIHDAISTPYIPVDRAWGRFENRLIYFSEPTIGQANPDGYETLTQNPTVNIAPGFYNDTQNIYLSGEGSIYYTTDGSTPTTASCVYDGTPLQITTNTSIRAVCYNGNKIPSDIVTFNYFINAPTYDLPVIKISMSEEDLFGTDGLYTNYTELYERQGNITFFLNGNQEFSINCGVKLFGNTSKKYPKKSFQIEFRPEYGTSRLEYKLFENLDIASFSNIVLRSGSQNTSSADSMFADEFLTSLMAQSGNSPNITVQAYRPCNLYLNGQYWGIYFIREKVDTDFLSMHYNISESSITMVYWPNYTTTGSSDQWDKIWNIIYKKPLDFSIDSNFKILEDQINLESFADLMIARLYGGDIDNDNIRAFKSAEYDDGKWNFILFDLDLSFTSKSRIENRLYNTLHNTNNSKPYVLFKALLQNDTFKALFLSRLSHHLKTTFLPDNTNKFINHIVSQMEKDMPLSINRWKTENVEGMRYIQDMERWYQNISRLRSYTNEDRIKWFVLDAAKALSLTKEDISKYMGEEFALYLD